MTDRRAKPAPTPSTRPRSDRSRGAVVRAGSSLIAVAALLAALVAQNGQRATDVRGLPGTAWLSGEIRGRAVLATAGGDAASVAVNVADAGARLDVVDLGRTVLVGNEAANTVSQLSAADGTELRTFDAVSDDGATLALVRAGEVAYLVDAGAGNVRRIDSEGPATAPRDLGTFDQWVGTANGELWVLNTRVGEVTAFDGDTTSTQSVGRLETGATLTAVGDEPIIADRGNERVRWIRSNESTPAPGLAAAAIAQPSDRADCLAVVAGQRLRCFAVDGTATEVAGAPKVTESSVVLTNNTAVVVAQTGGARVDFLTWSTRSWRSAERPAPSGRRLSGWSSSGPLLVDDPGSAYAFTVDERGLSPLDKFSKKTALKGSGDDGTEGEDDLNPDGPDPADEPANQAKRLEPTPDLNGPDVPPVLRPDRVVTRSGRTVLIDALANDTEPNGQPLVIASAGPVDPASGSVVISEDQRVVYAPPADFVGEVSFPYTASDSGQFSASSTISVRVVGLDRNTAPRLTDDAATTGRNTSIAIDVLANDRDDEGDPLAVTATTAPAHGAAEVRGGDVRYVPTSGFVGTDSFVYTASDGYGGESTATVTVTVTERQDNRAPVATDDRVSIKPGARRSVDVLANDSDPDGDPLQIVEVGSSPGLTAALTPTQELDITVSSGAVGPLRFTYTIADPAGLRSTANVVLVIDTTVTNRAPVAVDDRARASTSAVSIDVLANDFDPDDEPLSIVGFTQPSDGAIVKSSPRTLRFSPAAGATGLRRFDYTVADPAGATATATVTIELGEPSSAPPIARDDSATGIAGSTVVIRPLDNDSDPDGQPITIVGEPVVRSGSATVTADQSIAFRPPDDQPGTFVIGYTIQNLAGKTSSANILVVLAARSSTNHPPIANPDSADATAGTSISIPVLANDADLDGDPIGITDVTTPSAGTAQVNGRNLVYAAPPAFVGQAAFKYTISDGRGGRATAVVSVLVQPRAKVAPLAVDDIAVSIGGAPVSLDVVANDLDPDGANSALALRNATSDSVELVVGDRVIKATPPSRPGQYVVVYVIEDGDGLTATARLTITVQNPPNRPPVANDDQATTPYGATLLLPVLANDTDPDGGRIVISDASVPAAAGAVAIVTRGLEFRPANGFSGLTLIRYTIVDEGGLTATASVAVTVDACAAVTPVLVDDVAVTPFETRVSINVLANDTSAVGTFAVLAPQAGRTSVTAPGVVAYTPARNFNGVDRFGYTVTTECGLVVTATVTVTVNRAPQAVADSATVESGAAVNIPVLGNDVDPDGDALSIDSIGDVTGGRADIRNGTVRFTADAGFVGVAGFTYTISDIGGLTASAAVAVTVTSPNSPPVAQDDAANATAPDPVSIPVLANDDDPDGDTLIIASVAAPPASTGTVTVSSRSIVFTPAAGFSGVAVFSYTASDQHGGTASATVRVSVAAANRAPTARDDDVALPDHSPIALDVLGNDSDPDGDELSIASVSAPVPAEAGTVARLGGIVRFTPDPAFSGTATISYTISDGRGGTSTAQIRIQVPAP